MTTTHLGNDVATSASRVSRVSRGTLLAHADLHNHSLASDGAGDPSEAFASMRRAGVDVAALTDHATDGLVPGIDDRDWERAGLLADAAQEDGAYVALRGFEWTSSGLGHMNVWFSQLWTSPGAGDRPDAAVMQRFYDWLGRRPRRHVHGGGDALVGFNHPGREPGRFGGFTYAPALLERVVGMEIFNRDEDYLFEGVDRGAASPLCECLDVGWRVGLSGVTDEHGSDWGYPLGRGRTGLWVAELSRPAVREAMRERRFFATRERGLRVDAAAASGNGRPARMGQTLRHTGGPLALLLDVDRGEAFHGETVRVQVLQTGRPLPRVVEERDVVLGDSAVELTTPVSRADGDWVVVRITDPSQPADWRAGGRWADAGHALAYTSPFFLC